MHSSDLDTRWCGAELARRPPMPNTRIHFRTGVYAGIAAMLLASCATEETGEDDESLDEPGLAETEQALFSGRFMIRSNGRPTQCIMADTDPGTGTRTNTLMNYCGHMTTYVSVYRNAPVRDVATGATQQGQSLVFANTEHDGFPRFLTTTDGKLTQSAHAWFAWVNGGVSGNRAFVHMPDGKIRVATANIYVSPTGNAYITRYNFQGKCLSDPNWFSSPLVVPCAQASTWSLQPI